MWIKHCVSTTCFSILVNGTPVNFFSSSLGLRQGDPLSPFLFVILMDALGWMAKAAIGKGFISGFPTDVLTMVLSMFPILFLQIHHSFASWIMAKSNH